MIVHANGTTVLTANLICKKGFWSIRQLLNIQEKNTQAVSNKLIFLSIRLGIESRVFSKNFSLMLFLHSEAWSKAVQIFRTFLINISILNKVNLNETP